MCRVLENKTAECFIISADLSSAFKEQFVAQAKKAQKICLIIGDNAESEYAKYAADGIVVDLSKEEHPAKAIKNIKKACPKALLGVVSRNRRHEAMIISECEPEFIIFKIWNDGFEKTADLLEWYNDFFLIQYAVWPMEDVEISKIKADFIIVDEAQYPSLSQRSK